jgi:hypothetical protein
MYFSSHGIFKPMFVSRGVSRLNFLSVLAHFIEITDQAVLSRSGVRTSISSAINDRQGMGFLMNGVLCFEIVESCLQRVKHRIFDVSDDFQLILPHVFSMHRN